MNTDGFVTEDDLILYAMQAAPEQEMKRVAAQIERDPQLGQRVDEIRSVLGLYANAASETVEAPPGALQRLQSRIEREREFEVAAPVSAASVVAEPKPSQRPGWSLPVLWSGWAVAALSLVGVGLLFQQSRATERQAALQASGLQSAQQQVASVAAERDRLRSSLQQQSSQLTAEQQQAMDAKSRAEQLAAQAAALHAKVSESDLQAQRAAAKADALIATANQNEDERKRLGDALTREQRIAAAASESQQVLAALADPSALHVTLTVPKEQKRPSGRGTYLASTGALVFTGSNLNSLPADKVYELWLLPSDGSAPVPAGTFKPDNAGNATLITNHFRQGVAASGFAITVEKAGGSTTPTMPIVLVGAA